MAELKPGEKTRINAPGAGGLIEQIAAQIDDLKAGVLGGQAADALKAIESSQKQVLDFRGENASLMSLVQRLEENQAKRIDDLTVQASDLQEIDLTTAMTDYQRAQTAYEAALRVTSTASQLSLMDFLR
jgi:flagellin-like hook-associated protein FlgL